MRTASSAAVPAKLVSTILADLHGRGHGVTRDWVERECERLADATEKAARPASIIVATALWAAGIRR